MTAINDVDDFAALDPFFRIVEEGLSGLVDGDNFFALLADDVAFEYVITVPGYPRYVVGRSAVAELYRPYGETCTVTAQQPPAIATRKSTGKTAEAVGAAGGRFSLAGVLIRPADVRGCRSTRASRAPDPRAARR